MEEIFKTALRLLDGADISGWKVITAAVVFAVLLIGLVALRAGGRKVIGYISKPTPSAPPPLHDDAGQTSDIPHDEWQSGDPDDAPKG